jgi:outer membrane protein TolC
MRTGGTLRRAMFMLFAGGTPALPILGGCAAPHAGTTTQPPSVAPTTQPAVEALQLDGSSLRPMYREVLAVDLPTVVRVAGAENLEIRAAQQRVEAARGRVESTVGSVLPAVVPTSVFEHVEGAVRATPGDLIGVGFNTFLVTGVAQWVINPGKVVYDIVAARKRLLATEFQERAVVLDTTRRSVIQFYELVRLQARVSAASQAIAEAEELLRITELRVTTGTGVPADKLRADAHLAATRQDLIVALKSFYDASVDLAVTLRLDPAVTLVPSIDSVSPVTLIREELALEDLLSIAVQYRPDLESARTLVAALAAERGATWWGSFGPQFQVGYQIGGITGHSNNTAAAEGIPGSLVVNPFSENGSFHSNPLVNGAIKEIIARGAKRLEGPSDQTFGFDEQQRWGASAGWRFSVSAFGDLKTARALEQHAIIAAEAQLDQVRAQVVGSQQASRTNYELIGLARRQVESAGEALRITQANLSVGTMTTLDVLQAQDALSQARVRFADAIVRYNQAQVNLLSALGILPVVGNLA